MVNNAVGQIQGFFLGEGEFASTPKGWRVPRGSESTALSQYTSPLHWTFFAEVTLLFYCLVTSAVLVAQREALWALPLVFSGMCTALVVRLQPSPQPA